MDNALSKALDQQTYVGALMNRMSYTSANLVTASENTTAAESVIRDADMAKEMTEYAKNQVLTQASQSMLQQSNQNSMDSLSIVSNSVGDVETIDEESTQSALHNVDENESELAKELEKVSSGMKINSAGDDASGYAISEKMRVRLRALDQCEDNVKIGANLLTIAAGGVSEQLDIMKKIREIALKASDGTYTDVDREVLQREVSQLFDEIDDIAYETTFNGVHLLDQRTVAKRDYWFDADAPYRVNRDSLPVIEQDGLTPTLGTYYEISANPVYDPSSIVQGSSLTSIATGEVVYYNDGTRQGCYVVQGNVGSQYVEIGGTQYALNFGSNVYMPEYAAVTSPNAGDVVTTAWRPTFSVSGSSYTVDTPTTYKLVEEPGTEELSYFVTGSSLTNVEIDFSALSAKVSNVKDLDGVGFSFTCGGCDQFVTVYFDAYSTETTRYEGTEGSVPPICYVVGVRDVDVSDLTDSLMAAIFNGIDKANGGTGDILTDGTTDASVTIADRHEIKLNYFAATGKYTLTKDGPTITLKNGRMGELMVDTFYNRWQNISIQGSDKGSQYTQITLPNTTLAALFPQTSDWWNLSSKVDTTAVDFDNCVRSREKASKFISKCDQAIEYLLDASTTLGAEINRMEYMESNLVTMQENEQNAESVMRDADMAKEMVAYVKANVLQRAAQAMLAQANQNRGRIGGLLG